MKYYEVSDDINFPGRWYVGDIVGVDNWHISMGDAKYLDPPLELKLVRFGRRMDLTFTEVFCVPVVSERVRVEISDVAGVDFVPLTIAGDGGKVFYYALVVSNVIDCVDESKSEFQKFELNDPVRPDKAGDYLVFTRLRLEASRIDAMEIFRILRYEGSLIVSENIKRRLERAKVTGVVFSRVC